MFLILSMGVGVAASRVLGLTRPASVTVKQGLL